MYGWIWNKLPGPVVVKLLLVLIVVAAIVAVLFQWVFPWVDTVLPLQDVTINESGGGS